MKINTHERKQPAIGSLAREPQPRVATACLAASESIRSWHRDAEYIGEEVYMYSSNNYLFWEA
jgi:hypothetical protein